MCHSLFERGKASGSSANMSFRIDDKVYITGSGTCFGTMKAEDFSVINTKGEHIEGILPSKEFPLHLALYNVRDVRAVIHTHSFYSTIWSCIVHENEKDCIPQYTPYLQMKLGSVGIVPYHKPGSKELFAAFEARINDSDGFLLQNHGPIVAGKDVMDAFAVIEELEESAKIAWTVQNKTHKFNNI